MKMNKIYTILIGALLACPVFASDAPNMKMQSRMQQTTQQWTQSAPTAGRGNAINQDDLNNMQQDPSVPVGDAAWTLILGLGLTYGAYTFLRKRKETYK
ncbi:MAG: hypothetical protein LIO93_02215 [Bacteroidales bacterium]|nr:hypothetical protein [Bacteroidales bacterium]